MLANIDWLKNLPAYTNIRDALQDIFAQGMKVLPRIHGRGAFDLEVQYVSIGAASMTRRVRANPSDYGQWGLFAVLVEKATDRNIRDDASESADGHGSGQVRLGCFCACDEVVAVLGSQ